MGVDTEGSSKRPRTEPQVSNLQGASFGGHNALSPICYSCNQHGHLARECTQNTSPLVCYTFKKSSYLAKDCKQDTTPPVCYTCGKASHISRNYQSKEG